ncbi:hypothetical protein BC830DRAFT_333948 [Chytriomyces sp. MP71]|nr:hypothetical protein BC830DRAFT_333948 [Chytriomyces sp. MP71]
MFGFGEINFVISVLDWVKNNLVTFLIAGVAGISLWWKMLIQQQADNIVNSRDGSGVPQHGITLAALTRKALTMPAQLLRDAAVLGAYHVKWVSAAPLVVATHPNTASIVLSDKFKCKRDAYNCEPKGVLALRDCGPLGLGDPDPRRGCQHRR